jgi:uncharacterized protein YcbK (DUF882 family)
MKVTGGREENPTNATLPMRKFWGVCLAFAGRKERSNLNRRTVGLHILSILIFFLGISVLTHAAEKPAEPDPSYRLRLYHTHTNEWIDVVYRIGDTYIPSAIGRLDQFLRDHRTGDVIQLDQRLFDLLHDLAADADAAVRGGV